VLYFYFVIFFRWNYGCKYIVCWHWQPSSQGLCKKRHGSLFDVDSYKRHAQRNGIFWLCLRWRK
jgi:hypothetical protein